MNVGGQHVVRNCERGVVEIGEHGEWKERRGVVEIVSNGVAVAVVVVHEHLLVFDRVRGFGVSVESIDSSAVDRLQHAARDGASDHGHRSLERQLEEVLDRGRRERRGARELGEG